MDDRTLIVTGNNYLEIVYGIGIQIECYDVVKKKKMSNWLQKNCSIYHKNQV